MKQTRPFSLRFSPKTLEALRKKARSTDRSVSYVIRLAVQSWLENEGEKDSLIVTRRSKKLVRKQ